MPKPQVTTSLNHEARITQNPDLQIYLNQLLERHHRTFSYSSWVFSGQTRHLDETLIPYPVQMPTPQYAHLTYTSFHLHEPIYLKPSCPMHNATSSRPSQAPSSISGSCSSSDLNTPFISPNQPSRTSFKLNPLNWMPFKLSQSRATDQRNHFPLERTISSIPRGDADSNWEYPSPQQMYNAMLRNGFDDTPEDAVESKYFEIFMFNLAQKLQSNPILFAVALSAAAQYMILATSKVYASCEKNHICCG